MIHFVGAGPGAVDLITVRGQRYLKEADVIIYAGSLVNKGLLEYAKEGCEVYHNLYDFFQCHIGTIINFAAGQRGRKITSGHAGPKQ